MTQQPVGDARDRIRTALTGRDVREVRMFGAHCFLVDDAMVVAARKDGSLLVRVDRATDAEHLEKPHAARAEMGAGRAMGPGWIRVDPRGITRDEDLLDWIETALARAPGS